VFIALAAAAAMATTTVSGPLAASPSALALATARRCTEFGLQRLVGSTRARCCG
jgi:hypothetical protein